MQRFSRPRPPFPPPCFFFLSSPLGSAGYFNPGLLAAFRCSCQTGPPFSWVWSVFLCSEGIEAGGFLFLSAGPDTHRIASEIFLARRSYRRSPTSILHSGVVKPPAPFNPDPRLFSPPVSARRDFCSAIHYFLAHFFSSPFSVLSFPALFCRLGRRFARPKCPLWKMTPSKPYSTSPRHTAG